MRIYRVSKGPIAGLPLRRGFGRAGERRGEHGAVPRIGTDGGADPRRAQAAEAAESPRGDARRSVPKTPHRHTRTPRSAESAPPGTAPFAPFSAKRPRRAGAQGAKPRGFALRNAGRGLGKGAQHQSPACPTNAHPLSLRRYGHIGRFSLPLAIAVRGVRAISSRAQRA